MRFRSRIARGDPPAISVVSSALCSGPHLVPVLPDGAAWQVLHRRSEQAPAGWLARAETRALAYASRTLAGGDSTMGCCCHHICFLFFLPASNIKSFFFVLCKTECILCKMVYFHHNVKDNRYFQIMSKTENL